MKTLTFIYNAKSGFFNSIIDCAHKILSPRTYSCTLCKLTHSSLGMKTDWREFLQELPFELEFPHADQIIELKLNRTPHLPALFLKNGSELTEVVSAPELNKISNLNHLIHYIRVRIDKI